MQERRKQPCGLLWSQIGRPFKVDLVAPKFLAVALAVAAVASCGTDAPGDAVPVAELTVGQYVFCSINGPPPAGYPEYVCPNPKGFCKCYPPDATETRFPPYQVVTILYPPPGNMSSITYTVGSTVGSVEQVQLTNQFGTGFEMTLGGPEAGVTTDFEAKFTAGSVTGHQNLDQIINTSTLGSMVQQDISNHAEDLFYIWLNPEVDLAQSSIDGAIRMNIRATAERWDENGNLVSYRGPDGQPRMQIEPISAAALDDPTLRTPEEHGWFDHLSRSYIDQILGLDDFYRHPAFDPANHPELYRYVQTFDLTGPEKANSNIPVTGGTIEYDSMRDTIDGTAAHAEITVKGGAIGQFYSFQGEAVWTFDYTDVRTDIQGTQKAASITLESTTPCLHASVDMYLDLAFGSWVPMARFTNYDCGTPPPTPAVPGSCGALTAGEGLVRGSSSQSALISCNGWYSLLIEDDGDLALIDGVGNGLWSSGTSGSQAQKAVMQPDGNFGLYDSSRRLWATNTYATPGSYLAVQDDGNLVVYDARNSPIWALNNPVPPAHCGQFLVGEGLSPGTGISSCNGRYWFVMQSDGNLVLYNTNTGAALWSTSTAVAGRLVMAIMQGDGNLVLYDRSYNPWAVVWASNTAGHDGAYFVIGDDGSLMLYNADGSGPIWRP
jgi:hypothetical protein